MKRRASDDEVLAFMTAVYPTGTALAVASFDERLVLTEATRLITELRASIMNVLHKDARKTDEINVLVRENLRLAGRASSLCKAVATVLDGFDQGIFVRDITGDTDPAWGVRLLPYISALATMRELKDV